MSGAQPPPAQRSDSGAADDVRASLAHRAFLRHAPRPFRGNELLARNGGDACVAALVDGLYDGIEQDRALRPLFNRDLSRDRANQKVFFTEWLGGEARYSERAYRSLQHRHDDLPITAALADRWLGHFRRSLERAVSDPADREEVFRQVQTLALALVHPAPAGVAWCGIEARTLARAATLARRGGVAALGPLLATTPGLTSPTYAARLLQCAALAGRADAVALLIEHHVDVDKPHYLETGLRAGDGGRAVCHATVRGALEAPRARRRRAACTRRAGRHLQRRVPR